MRLIAMLAGACLTATSAFADEIAVKEAYREYVAADARGDKKKALAAAEKAYALAKAEWGASDRQTGALAANYANQLTIAGRDGDAIIAFEECAELLAVLENALLDRIGCLLGAGNAYLRKDDYEKGHLRYREVIAAGEAKAGEDPAIAIVVGDAYMGLTLYSESLPLALSPRGRIGSGTTSSRLITRPPDRDASLVEVKANAQRAAQLYELAGAADSVSYAAAMRVLGAASKLEGEYAAAFEFYRKGADILAAKLGETDRQTILMRGRQKFTEYELFKLGEADEPPFTRVLSSPDCKLYWSGGAEMETCVKLRIPPYFPNSQLYKDQQGFALLRFDITDKGATENIEVLIDWPGGVFTERAVKAASKWSYTPPTDQEGRAGRIEDVETIIQYIIR